MNIYWVRITRRNGETTDLTPQWTEEAAGRILKRYKAMRHIHKAELMTGVVR